MLAPHPFIAAAARFSCCVALLITCLPLLVIVTLQPGIGLVSLHVLVNRSQRSAYEAFSSAQSRVPLQQAAIKGSQLQSIAPQADVYLPASYLLLPPGIPLPLVLNADYYPLL